MQDNRGPSRADPEAGRDVGHAYEAQSSYERNGDRRRVIAWRFENLERLRDHHRDRGSLEIDPKKLD